MNSSISDAVKRAVEEMTNLRKGQIQAAHDRVNSPDVQSIAGALDRGLRDFVEVLAGYKAAFKSKSDDPAHGVTYNTFPLNPRAAVASGSYAEVRCDPRDPSKVVLAVRLPVLLRDEELTLPSDDFAGDVPANDSAPIVLRTSGQRTEMVVPRNIAELPGSPLDHIEVFRHDNRRGWSSVFSRVPRGTLGALLDAYLQEALGKVVLSGKPPAPPSGAQATPRLDA